MRRFPHLRTYGTARVTVDCPNCGAELTVDATCTDPGEPATRWDPGSSPEWEYDIPACPLMEREDGGAQPGEMMECERTIALADRLDRMVVQRLDECAYD